MPSSAPASRSMGPSRDFNDSRSGDDLSSQSTDTRWREGVYDEADGEDDDDDDAYSVLSDSSLAGRSASHLKAELGSWHYLPLLFVVLPLLGGAVVGRGEAWRDLLVLGLVGYWVYWLIKTPWELYHASLHHSLIASPTSPTSPLSKDHHFYLALTLISPLVGALLLTMIRSTLTYIPSYLSPSSIRLFLLAALIKPFSNLVGLLMHRTETLKSSLAAPNIDEAEVLRRRLRGLEREVKVLRSEAASRREVGTLRADVYAGEGGLTELGRQVRRVERRAELGRLTLGERVELVQRGLLGLREEVEEDREKQGYAFGQWLLQLLHISSGGSDGRHAQLGKGGLLYSQTGLLTPKAHPDAKAPLQVRDAQEQDRPIKPRPGLVQTSSSLFFDSASLCVKLVFWPLVLAKWAAGQLLEVVRAS